MTRVILRRCFAFAFAIVPALALISSSAPAAPPILRGLRDYRVVDASGRVEYRPAAVAPGRSISYRPTHAPSILLRGRPYQLSGYAGANYGPTMPGGAPYPTRYKQATGHRLDGFLSFLWRAW